MSRFQDHDTGTLVGISFDTPFRAQEFLIAATGLAASNKLLLKDAVVIVKNAEGEVTVRETIDPSLGRSAWSGAVWAGLFGLILGGPVGWVAGIAVGAGGGALGSHLIDLGISDDWVGWFRNSVQPGTATVALLVDEVDRNALVSEAARFSGAELVYSNFEEHTLERIRDALGEPVTGQGGPTGATGRTDPSPSSGQAISPET